MKKLLALTFTALLLFAACDPAVSGVSVSGQDVQPYIERDNELTTAQRLDGPSVAVFGTLDDNANEVLTLTFAHLLDEDTIQDNVQLIPLTNGADAASVYTEGTPLSYSYALIPSSTTSWQLRLSFDLSSYGADRLLLQINPGLTAENGSRLFQMDGDDLLAEEDDDLYVNYLVVADDGTNANTITPLTGVQKEVSRTNLSNFAEGVRDRDISGGTNVAAIEIPFNVTGNDDTLFTDDSLGSSFEFYKLNPVDGTWSNATSEWTSAYSTGATVDGNGTLTFTNTSAVEGDCYKYEYNQSLVQESAAYRGFIHRRSSNDLIANSTSTSNIIVIDSSVATARFQDGSVSLTNRNNDQHYVDLTITAAAGLSDILITEITSDAVQFYMDDKAVDFSDVIVEDLNSDNKFRIIFPDGTFDNVTTITVVVRPVIENQVDILNPSDNQTIYDSGRSDLSMMASSP